MLWAINGFLIVLDQPVVKWITEKIIPLMITSLFERGLDAKRDVQNS